MEEGRDVLLCGRPQSVTNLCGGLGVCTLLELQGAHGTFTWECREGAWRRSVKFAESECRRERQQHVLRCVCILCCPRRQTAERCRIAPAEVTFSSVGKHTEGTAGGKLRKKVKVAVAFFCLFLWKLVLLPIFLKKSLNCCMSTNGYEREAGSSGDFVEFKVTGISSY